VLRLLALTFRNVVIGQSVEFQAGRFCQRDGLSYLGTQAFDDRPRHFHRRKQPIPKRPNAVRGILAAVGGRLDDIVSLTIFFLNAADLPSIQKVRAEKFTPAGAPASVLIQTLGLVAPELPVELVPIAVPEDRYHDPKL